MKMPITFKTEKQFNTWRGKNFAEFDNSAPFVFRYPWVLLRSADEFLIVLLSEGSYIYRFSCDLTTKVNEDNLDAWLLEDYNYSEESLKMFRDFFRDSGWYDVEPNVVTLNYPITVCRVISSTSEALDLYLYLNDRSDSRLRPRIIDDYARIMNYKKYHNFEEKELLKKLDRKEKAVYLGANPDHNWFDDEIFVDDYGKKEYLDELSKKELNEIYDMGMRQIKEREFEEKCKNQRTERGYSDSDVWNFHYWFTETCSKMLKDLADKHMGFPSELDYEYFKANKENLYTQDYETWCCYPKNKKERAQKDKASDFCSKQWEDILNRMSFLLNEMDEDNCSMAVKKEELLDKWSEIREEFETKYGAFGDKLKTKDIIEKEKKDGSKYWYSPDYLPENDELRLRHDAAWKELQDYEKKMFKYQNDCKDELFDLMKKYFWNLWD